MSPSPKLFPCPCHSGLPYESCCKPFHLGENPSTAVQLVRARFAAYALNLPDYIMKTTHPASSQYQYNLLLWKQQIAAFAKNAQFQGLEILSTEELSETAIVVFKAHIVQKKKDSSFIEKSYFEKREGKWLYRNGRLFEGHSPNLLTTHQTRLLPLAYYGEPILRKIAEPVGEITKDLRQFIEEMLETLDAYDAIGLAAPQVFHSIQVFVIREPTEKANGEIDFGETKVFIDPKIIHSGQEIWDCSEGCLSVPSIYPEVTRPKEITIEYTDLEGVRKTETASGFRARMIQHENDHLNGVLFLDLLSPKEQKRIEKQLEALYERIRAPLKM